MSGETFAEDPLRVLRAAQFSARFGFTVADEGYTLFIPAGTIAPEERGMVEISFPHRALYPGFVGDVMDEEDYSALLPMLSAAAAACGPDFTGFAGAPEGELAAAIIGEYLSAQAIDDLECAWCT